ncbi:hypothetical protein [uncultured Sphingomonas sp.]|uniref:hypothetical protein n=1 Tax=uncultured Sphingomonas sp. TaxID=158754 RepID=UPI0025DAA426|nr:hypothetical protein [uncultured Sphingomonas sp.]
MQRAALAAGDTSQATRLAIQAADAQRIEAERTSAALAQEAGALERVQIELMQSAQAVEVFVTSHQRIAQAAQIDRDAAEAATRLAGAQQLLAREAIEVRSAIDPMYAAQVRFDQEMEKADRLLSAGVFGQREYGQAVQVARDRLQQHAVAVAGNVAQEVSHARQLGRTQAAMQGISYQAQDTFTQLSMGANVFNVLAVQGMQATGQMTLLDGKVGKFAQTMQGPYGLAISAGILVLGALTKDLDLFDDKLGDAIESLKKDAEQSAMTDLAKRRFRVSIEGVSEAIREQSKALDDSIKSTRSAAEQSNIAAKVERDRQIAIRRTTLALLEKAKAELAATQSIVGDTEATQFFDQRRVREAEIAVEKARKDLETAEQSVQRSRIELANEAALRAVDPIAQINKLYDDQVAAAKRAANAEAKRGQVVDGNLTREIAGIERKRKAELEAEQARQQRQRRAERDSTGSANRQFGREIDIAGARAIVASIGGRVTSGLRSRADQERIFADKQAGRHVGPVARPGTSAHERGQALDIAYGPGISVASIKKAFADAGVTLRKVLNEPSQRVYHVEWGKPGKAGPSAETMQRRAQAEERKDLRDDTAFTRDYLQARRKLLDATARTATSADREALAREEIEAEAVAEQREIGNRLKAGSISAEQALMQSAVVEGTRKQRLQNIEIDKATRLIEARYDTAAEEGASRLDVLRIQQDTAATERERRQIGREILDLEQQLRRQTLERVRDTSQDPLAVQRARDQLGRLPEIEAAEDTRFAQQASSPIEAYRDRLKAATSDTTNALQSIAVDGFGRLEDAGASAAAQAVTDLLGIGGVAGEVIGGVVADLARLAIQKAIVASIGGGIFGFADGGALSVLPGYADGGIPGFAGGGSPGGLIRGPGTGRSDSILAMLSNGKGAIRVSNKEFIVNAAATAQWLPELAAINSGRLKKFAGGGLIAPSMPTLREPRPNYARMRSASQDRLQVDTRVRVDASDMLMARVEETSVRAVGAAAEPIMAGATSKTMRKLSRPGLPGGWG